MRTRAMIPLVAVLLAAGPTAAQQPADSMILRMLRERVAAKRAVGLVVGLIDADGNRRILAAGSTGTEGGDVGGESVFEIGSITKAFTGILLAEMAGRGEVALDDPVQRHLPPGTVVPAGEDRPITLVDLSSQVSGLPRLPDGFRPADWADPYVDYGADDLYAFLAAHELRRAPGAEYEYSNLGAGLLGHALAHAVGTSYEAVVRDRILVPLGMDDTGITLDTGRQARLAQGHNALAAPVANWHFDALAGAGALRSTAHDMLTFLAANIDPPATPLGRALQASHEPRATAGPNMRVGLGWHILRTGEGEIVWHNGGTAGYRTFAGFDPVRRTGVVVLSNMGGPGHDDLGFHLLHPSVPLQTGND